MTSRSLKAKSNSYGNPHRPVDKTGGESKVEGGGKEDDKFRIDTSNIRLGRHGYDTGKSEPSEYGKRETSLDTSGIGKSEAIQSYNEYGRLGEKAPRFLKWSGTLIHQKGGIKRH